jgi:hypothetical protein
MELLFESRTNLEQFTGHLNFVQRTPEIHPEPVLQPDTPGDARGVSIYGSVLDDGGRLRMWYHATPERLGGDTDVSVVAYAESDDGISWTKPALDLVTLGGSPSHLVNLPLHSATVFIDPDSPPSHRYRATGYGNPWLQVVMAHPEGNGYYTAHSADGLCWELDGPAPRWPSGDVITSVYHPGRHGALTAMKFTPRNMRLMRRSIHTAEFHDGAYGEAVSALYPDEFDDICAAARGFHSCDYYGMGMLPAGRGTVGFLWNYWHELPYTTCGALQPVALYGTSDITLVYQPEPGGRWLHLPGRPNFVDHADVPWARNGWINSAANVVEVGDEQRLYFSGNSQSHGYGAEPNWTSAEAWRAYKEQHTRSGITFARWPKWRLFGFEADPEGSFTIRLGRLDTPMRLALNYEVIKPEGRVRAEVHADEMVHNVLKQEHVPHALADSVPLTGDSLNATLAWKTGDFIPPASDVKVTLHLANARVYAYELIPS